MVDRASVQAKVNRGLAKAATVLGAPCAWYRPSGSGNPLASGNSLGTLQALLDTNANLKQTSPRLRDKPENWYGAFDFTNVHVGDYLIDPDLGTFFVTAMDSLRAARLASCNQVLSLKRPGEQTHGDSYYGGAQVATMTTLLTSWPAAVIQGTKGNEGETKLPGDVRLPWYTILLPASVPVQVLPADWAIADLSTDIFYTISSTELTSLGWRLTASLANP